MLWSVGERDIGWFFDGLIEVSVRGIQAFSLEVALPGFSFAVKCPKPRALLHSRIPKLQ